MCERVLEMWKVRESVIIPRETCCCDFNLERIMLINLSMVEFLASVQDA